MTSTRDARAWVATLVVVAAAGCGDELAVEPAAVVVAAMPEALDPSDDARDDLSIVVAYEDGDADLGGGLAYVHDCRSAAVVTALPLAPIASDEALAEGVPIRGTLELWVNDVGDVALDAAAPEACAALGVDAPAAGAATFCVVLEDAAGHQGPGDCTAAIAIAAPAP